MKLALGGAQFGMVYGVANPGVQTSPQEVRAILHDAAEAGLDLIDTAVAYGNSESVLGCALRDIPASFRIVSKIPPLRKAAFTPADGRMLRQLFEDALHRLGLPRIYGLQMHHADDMLAPGGEVLFGELTRLKAEGLVTKIGISAYSPQQAQRVLDRFPIDLLQLPVNLFDQRAVAGGYLKRFKTLSIEIHARSAFLQGLLFMSPATLSAFFDSVKPTLTRLQDEARRQGVPVQSLALGYLQSIDEIDRIVIGVETAAQLRDNLAAYKWSGSQIMDSSVFACTDERIINPSQWQIA